ncbi:hypothetical protein D046_4151B, partial [Vibrio parahaemolyticus V-223/04]
ASHSITYSKFLLTPDINLVTSTLGKRSS